MMCGIIARDKRTGQIGKRGFKHYGDAVRWMYKHVGRNKRFTVENMFPKKTAYFRRFRASYLPR